MAIIIGRSIENISLNGLEYLLNDDLEPRQFQDKAEALQLLREAGYVGTEEEFEGSFIFEEV